MSNPQWKIKAQAFAQQLADLLGYEVWVAKDKLFDCWHIGNTQPEPLTFLGYWGWPGHEWPIAPSFGNPRNWKNTLVHAKPGDTT